MLCDPPSMPSTDSDWSSTINEKKQLSFIYQPGVGLYDKKNDVDERIQIMESTLRRQNEQDSLEKFFSSDEILSDKNHQIK
jgi:hypothetical protein